MQLQVMSATQCKYIKRGPVDSLAALYDAQAHCIVHVQHAPTDSVIFTRVFCIGCICRDAIQTPRLQAYSWIDNCNGCNSAARQYQIVLLADTTKVVLSQQLSLTTSVAYSMQTLAKQEIKFGSHHQQERGVNSVHGTGHVQGLVVQSGLQAHP